MSVTVRPYRRGGWEVDITIRLPNGSRFRERSKSPASSKSAALRWGEDRERHLLQHGLPEAPKDVPTLEAFAPRFLDGHVVANRLKPSGVVSKESIIRVHLVPMLGSKKLDAITNEHVQRVKRQLVDHAPKTVNNVLTVLRVLPCPAVLVYVSVHAASERRFTAGDVLRTHSQSLTSGISRTRGRVVHR